MIPDNYDDIIRPALARFCGWKPYKGLFVNSRQDDANKASCPDPLRNAADAWGLQKVLWEKSYTVDIHRNYDDMAHMRTGIATYITACCLTHCGTPSQRWHGEGNTPELALVLAAYEVVREEVEE